MSNSLMLNVAEDFDVNQFVTQVRDTYQAKGFNVQAMAMGNSVRIRLEKGMNGFSLIMGMGQAVTANCMFQGENIVVNFDEYAWVDKLVGWLLNFVLLIIPFIGWVACVARFICIVIGVVRQVSLSKNVKNDMAMIISGISGTGFNGVM